MAYGITVSQQIYGNKFKFSSAVPRTSQEEKVTNLCHLYHGSSGLCEQLAQVRYMEVNRDRNMEIWFWIPESF